MTTLKVIQTTEVEDYVLQLADRLEAQYKEYHVKSLTQFTSQWANKQLEDVKNGTANLMRFVVTKGRKYFKITAHEYDTFQDRNEYKEGSVNCFVNKNTGEVHKPASWKSPLKNVRYDLRIIKEREYVYENCDWAGGWLYLRRG